MFRLAPRSLVLLLAQVVSGCAEGPPTWSDQFEASTVLASIEFSRMPLDVKRFGDSLFVLLPRDTLVTLEFSGDRLKEIDRRSIAEATPGGRSLVASDDMVSVWEPEVGRLTPVPLFGSTAARTLGPPDVDWWLPPDPTPRGHGRLAPIEGGYITEVRERVPQEHSLYTLGHLLFVPSPGDSFDTLRSFSAPSYSHPRGPQVLCCNLPRYFAPNPQWAVTDSAVVIFEDETSTLLWLNVDGTTLDRLPVPLSRDSVTDANIVRYAFAQVQFARRDESAWYFWRLKHRLKREISRIRTMFEHDGALATQLLVDAEGAVWLRRFDPDVWPYGLSDSWLRISSDRQSIEDVRFASNAVVYGFSADGTATVAAYGHRVVRVAIVRAPGTQSSSR